MQCLGFTRSCCFSVSRFWPPRVYFVSSENNGTLMTTSSFRETPPNVLGPGSITLLPAVNIMLRCSEVVGVHVTDPLASILSLSRAFHALRSAQPVIRLVSAIIWGSTWAPFFQTIANFRSNKASAVHSPRLSYFLASINVLCILQAVAFLYKLLKREQLSGHA